MVVAAVAAVVGVVAAAIVGVAVVAEHVLRFCINHGNFGVWCGQARPGTEDNLILVLECTGPSRDTRTMRSEAVNPLKKQKALPKNDPHPIREVIHTLLVIPHVLNFVLCLRTST